MNDVLETNRRWYLRQQRRTTLATAYAARWTPTDDAYLLDDTNGTVSERAAHLGRTYRAARHRLTQLRKTPHLLA